MIIAYVGGIGSGKTLGIVKDIIDTKNYAVTNFPLKNYSNYYRIKVSDIITKTDKKFSVNWKFWEKLITEHENYSIYLDEIHNIIHARRAMSHLNIQMSKWVSQIRKILMDKPKNHLFIISQSIRKIDIDFRELAQIIVKCKKLVTNKGNILMRQDFYDGLDNYLCGVRKCSKIYNPMKYYRFYDRNKIVTFEDSEDFL
jgi:hypothetical protein